MDLTMRYADDAVALATYGPIVIQIWRGEPTRPRLERLVALMMEHARAIGAPIGVLTVLEEHSPPPAPEEMGFLAPYFATLPGTALGAMAVALEAKDDLAEVRLAAESLGGELGPRLDLKLCFAPEEACAWLARRMIPDADPSLRRELTRVVELVREQIG